MINRDFQDFSDRVARVKAKSGTGHDLGRSGGAAGCDDPADLVAGSTFEATEETSPPWSPTTTTSSDRSDPSRSLHPMQLLKPDDNGKERGDPAGGEGKTKRPRGGFSVQFREMGHEMHRASYVSSERTIYVNLDHQIVAAKGAGAIDDPVFRRLTYEIAFSEYAIALATEMDKNGEFIEPSDAMVEVRETLNRMARRAAVLYAS